MARALEDVEAGRIKRLLVTMPPRHGKSELASVRFPAWFLGRNPDRRLILVSHTATLAYRFSRQIRNLVEDSRYAEVFPGIALAGDSRSVDAWDLADRRGGLLAVGVGGGATGHGAHLLIIDDPVKNREEANSELVRTNVWDWYTSTAYTRLEEEAAVVVIQTRWHEDDLSGRLLMAQDSDPRADRWTHLHLPALSDDGQALWPEKYPVAELERIRATVGPYDWESIYQGRPRSPEGALIKVGWLQVVDAAPGGLNWVRGWDLAASTKTTADYTAGARCAFDKDGNFWVADMARGRWEWPDTRKHMARLAAQESGDTYGVESQGFQLSAIQELLRDPAMRGVAIREVKADRDKVSRALPWITRAEAGKVFLVRGPWNAQFISEAVAFPLGRHDDQIDAVSVAYQVQAVAFDASAIIAAENLISNTYSRLQDVA